MLNAVAIPGLAIVEERGRGGGATVYLAERDGRRYALKVADVPPGPGAEAAVARFRREAATLARLTDPAVARVADAGTVDDRPYLVLEWVEGVSLATPLADGPLPTERVIALARALAGALDNMHRLGLVHRAIAPWNVICGSDGSFTLVNLGLVVDPRADGGDDRFLYAAPEVLGALDRPIDGRSDLYALGCVLFHAIVGRPPFLADTARDVARLQTVGPPPSLAALASTLPRPLEDLIAALIQRDPDDRPSSAAEVRARLDRLDRAGGARDEEPGAPWLPGEMVSASPPLGRDDVVGRLVSSWSRACDGDGSLVLLAGEQGIGKTTILAALARQACPRARVLLVGGAGGERPEPLASIRRALDDWLVRIERLAVAERASVYASVREAAGDLAPLVARVSPWLASALETVPEAGVEASLSDHREQLYGAIALFLRRLAVLHGPGLLLLDDAHTLDEVTQQVLRRLASTAEQAPLLVVLAGRAEAGSLADVEADLALGEASTIQLGPLSPPAVAALVGDFLGGRPVDPDIARWLVERSHGNPRAVVDYLHAMLDLGVVRPTWAGWTLDREGLAELRLPSDLVDLAMRRLDGLVPSTLDILTAAAAQLEAIDLSLLVVTADSDTVDVAHAIEDALGAGLVEREGGAYRFVHERVRDALLDRAGPDERRRLHQRIAETLDIGPDFPPDRLFAIARQYALGDSSRPERAYLANGMAGLRALDDLADRAAARFLTAAHEIAERAGRPVDPVVEERLGDLAARDGRWTEALERYRLALDPPGADEYPIRAARVYGRRARARMANRQVAEAWSDLRAGFARVQAPFPEATLLSLLYSVMLGLVGLVIGRVRHWLKRPTGTARERLLALAQLYEVGGFLAYLDDSRRAIAQMMLRCLFTAERLGPCPELAVTYMGWALTLALLRHRRLSARAATEAIRVSEEIGDRFTLARARVAHAWSIHVAGNPRAGEAAAVRALTEHAHWLDVHSYYIGCNDLVWNLLMRGYCREGWRWLQEGLLRAEEAGGQRESFAGSAAALTAVLGRTAEAQSYLERARRVGDEMPRERWWWMDLLGKETLVLLESNDLGLPLDDAIARRRELGLRPGSGSFHTHHFFVFQGYARLAQCLRSPRAQLTSRLLQLEDAVAELRRAAVHPTLRCHLLALIGALHDLRGEPEAALPTLDRAEAIANRYDNPWALFETFRARARLLRRQGDREAAGRQASFAYTLAAHHGWVTRSRWVRAEFQLDSVVYSSTSALDGSDREGTAPLEARSLKRQLDALLQVSLTTGTVLDPERQARVVLDEIIRILGAEHGFLFLVGAKDALELRAGRDAIGRDLAAAGDFSRAVLETVSTTLEPVIVSGDDRMARSLDGEGAMGPRSIVAAPLVLHGRFLGVVYVENRVARGTFSEDELAVLRALAVHIAIVIRIAEGFEATARLLDVVRRQVVDLQQSRQRITAAEERLKQEIAEMLHSRVQTRLLLAWHRLGGAIGRIAGDPQGAQEELSRIRDDIDDIREREIRQASHLLHPSIIRVGLVPAVRSLISRIGDQLALDLHVDPALAAADDPIENKLSEPLRLTVYRFIEEALANVQRHAKAGRVWLSLGLDGGEVVVVVRDDGVGFDVAARRSGLGLQSIADRVDQEGGTWSIESTPGAGTQLTARVPCELRETEESAAT